jgi:hypothetical protein
MPNTVREKEMNAMEEQRWSAWGSPVGLGLFFVLVATAIEIARLAFK